MAGMLVQDLRGRCHPLRPVCQNCLKNWIFQLEINNPSTPLTLWKTITQSKEMFPLLNGILESLRINRVKLSKFCEELILVRDLLGISK